MESTKFKKVMVIDDTSIDRIIAKRVMEKYSFSEEIVLMESVRQAINFLQTMKDTPADLPDLIFLDINMPELSGFDFLDQYQDLPEVIQRNCIIMMLSTSLNQEDHLKANSNCHVSGFLNKPLDPVKLGLVSSKKGGTEIKAA